MYKLIIEAKTKLNLPNGSSIILNKGDVLEFSQISEEKKDTSVSEEHFLIADTDWRYDHNNGLFYTTIISKYLDRVDSAHISPDMILDVNMSRRLKEFIISSLKFQSIGGNRVKLTTSDLQIPSSLSIDVVFIRNNK